MSINIFGKNCSLEFNLNSTDNFTIEYDKNVVECTEQHLEGNELHLEFDPVSKGDTYLVVNEEDGTAREVRLYVHPSKLITIDNYFGRCRGDITLSVSISMILAMLLIILWEKYKKSTKENLCRYSNAWLLG